MLYPEKVLDKMDTMRKPSAVEVTLQFEFENWKKILDELNVTHWVLNLSDWMGMDYWFIWDDAE